MSKVGQFRFTPHQHEWCTILQNVVYRKISCCFWLFAMNNQLCCGKMYLPFPASGNGIGLFNKWSYTVKISFVNLGSDDEESLVANKWKVTSHMMCKSSDNSVMIAWRKGCFSKQSCQFTSPGQEQMI